MEKIYFYKTTSFFLVSIFTVALWDRQVRAQAETSRKDPSLTTFPAKTEAQLGKCRPLPVSAWPITELESFRGGQGGSKFSLQQEKQENNRCETQQLVENTTGNFLNI